MLYICQRHQLPQMGCRGDMRLLVPHGRVRVWLPCRLDSFNTFTALSTGRYCVLYVNNTPPLVLTMDPVTFRSFIQYKYASATSSAPAIFLVVDFDTKAWNVFCFASLGTVDHVSVSTAPRATALTRIGRISRARFLVSPITAERAPAMALQFGMGFSVTTPVVSVIDDSKLLVRYLSACFTSKIGAM